MDTKIKEHKFLLVETEHSELLDIFSKHGLLLYSTDYFNFLLWKNEGEYAIITKDQVKEALRVFKELNSAPEGQLSTAKPPVIYWDDCAPVSHWLIGVLLGEEHQLYREAEKPEDGSDG